MKLRWYVILLLVVLISGCQSSIDSSIKCVPAGCSNQLCISEDAAEGIVTTCEYREEYQCLKLTNCGFYDGECKWEETSDYTECLENI